MFPMLGDDELSRSGTIELPRSTSTLELYEIVFEFFNQ